MIHRASKLHLPTLRDAPSDAEALSHKLLVRGGFIRQVSAGLWTLLPLGWRVHRKVEQIVREEMDAIGAQEMFAPVLTPAELWIKSGRYGIPELFKLQDRNGRDYVLPITHEETFAFHAVELQSYRQLPQSWYHFQTKNRDEPRPRGGLLRVREFVMKDSYSFDRDEAGLDVSFQAHKGAYERIWDRCGLEAHGVQAESGMMGGKESLDYLSPSGSGENTLVRCENGDYAADLEIALGVPRAPDPPERLDAPGEVETPDTRTCEALAELLSIDLAATTKAMPVVKDDGTLVLALLRGRRPPRGGEAPGGARLRFPSGDRRGDRGGLRRGGWLARDRSASRGRSSPTRRCARVSSSPARTAPAGICAASRRAATIRPSSPTSASRRRATRAPTAAAGSASRPRSRSATSSSSARGTPRLSAPGTWTRTAPRSRS